MVAVSGGPPEKEENEYIDLDADDEKSSAGTEAPNTAWSSPLKPHANLDEPASQASRVQMSRASPASATKPSSHSPSPHCAPTSGQERSMSRSPSFPKVVIYSAPAARAAVAPSPSRKSVEPHTAVRNLAAIPAPAAGTNAQLPAATVRVGNIYASCEAAYDACLAMGRATEPDFQGSFMDSNRGEAKSWSFHCLGGGRVSKSSAGLCKWRISMKGNSGQLSVVSVATVHSCREGHRRFSNAEKAFLQRKIDDLAAFELEVQQLAPGYNIGRLSSGSGYQRSMSIGCRQQCSFVIRLQRLSFSRWVVSDAVLSHNSACRGVHKPRAGGRKRAKTKTMSRADRLSQWAQEDSSDTDLDIVDDDDGEASSDEEVSHASSVTFKSGHSFKEHISDLYDVELVTDGGVQAPKPYTPGDRLILRCSGDILAAQSSHATCTFRAVAIASEDGLWVFDADQSCLTHTTGCSCLSQRRSIPAAGPSSKRKRSLTPETTVNTHKAAKTLLPHVLQGQTTDHAASMSVAPLAKKASSAASMPPPKLVTPMAARADLAAASSLASLPWKQSVMAPSSSPATSLSGLSQLSLASSKTTEMLKVLKLYLPVVAEAYLANLAERLVRSGVDSSFIQTLTCEELARLDLETSPTSMHGLCAQFKQRALAGKRLAAHPVLDPQQVSWLRAQDDIGPILRFMHSSLGSAGVLKWFSDHSVGIALFRQPSKHPGSQLIQSMQWLGSAPMTTCEMMMLCCRLDAWGQACAQLDGR